MRRRLRARALVGLSVLSVLLAFGVGGARAVGIHGIGFSKGCAGPTAIGKPYSCTYVITNAFDTAHDTLQISSLIDRVFAASATETSANIVQDGALVASGGATCVGGTGTGTIADPYLGSTSCNLPFGGTISVQPFSFYEVQPADYGLTGHVLADQATLTWGDLCDFDTAPINCPVGPQNQQSGSQTTVTQLSASTATTIHNAGDAPVSTVEVGTTVHDSVTVTGQPGQPTPRGDVTLEWFANGTCANPAVQSTTVTLDQEGTFHATDFAFTPAPGRFAFQATYLGDGTYTSSEGPCEPLAVVDSYITVSPPEATNATGTNHAYTANVFVDAGSGYVAAPDGTLVTFALLAGSVGSFSGASTCSTSAGACSVTTTSSVAGSDTMQASATVTVGGVSMTRTTGQPAAGHANGANAVKHWESLPPSTPPPSTPPPSAPPPSAPPPATAHPAITIVKSPDVQTIPSGGTATWTITVTNSGDVALTNVRVTDAEAPGCARTQADLPALGSMAPGASASYSCSSANVAADFTNVAVATGTPSEGPDVTARDDARVQILLPAIQIVKTPDLQEILQGATATFTITVTNTGQVPLTNVRVTDPQAPACTRTQAELPALAAMAPGASVMYTCARGEVQESFANVAVATGTPPVGNDVTDDDDARVVVRLPHPAIAIVKSPKRQVVDSGGTAAFEITVTNTGDVTLTNVTVTDELAPDCNRSLGTLAPGQAAPTYTCTMANVTAAFDNVAVAAGTPPSGPSVTASDTAPVTVRTPAKPSGPAKKPPTVVAKKKPKVTG